jgi:hypothetical protein
MSICREEERQKGGAYPRSCPTCGLAKYCTRGLGEQPPGGQEGFQIVTQAISFDRVKELMVVIGKWTLDEGIVVLTHVLGQLVASKADGIPGKIMVTLNRLFPALKVAALQKMVHDDEQRRAAGKQDAVPPVVRH